MFDIERHKLILLQILKAIYSDMEISSHLGFKGGTALYFFYNLPRFSVDLDFNLLEENKKEIIYEKIDNILRQFGSLKDKKIKRSTLFFLLSYRDAERNIKIEISMREFPDNYELKNYFGIPMKVMKEEDMFAHKLAALLDRKSLANRDLFDIWYFMKERCAFNQELLRLRTGTDTKSYLTRCAEAISKVKDTYILQGLGEVLDEKMKIWVKNNLKKELTFLLNYYKDNPLVV